ncbi:MAG: START domain-containing protein [Haliscomenobacter sp.]|nr:START domain-containing protein [Haliscomenobacter sp.]MBK8655533.1 START domain-containing protein [Haliscomenobacter sp.]MBP9874929.1 START domain-containing protein [Haliscomenobacter sp.]
MRIPTITLLFIAFSFALAAQETPWKLKKASDGIEVYYRSVPESAINELRIKTSIRASMPALLSVMRDFSRYPQWIYQCTEASRIEKVNEREFIYYGVMDFPWPLADRDFVARSKMTRNPETGAVHIEVKGAPGYKPLVKDRVRIPVMHYHWTLTPENGVLLVDYQLKSDPGGSLPAWAINLGLDQGPVQTIKNLRQLAMKTSGNSANLAYIEDREEHKP